MGWWQGDTEADVLGDGPADTLSAALEEIARAERRTPPLREFLQSLRAALLYSPGSLLLEGAVPIASLTAHMNDGSHVSTEGDATVSSVSLKLLYQALQDVVADYQTMEDHRKPRLSEVLGTAAFILGPDSQTFVESPSGSGVLRITAATGDTGGVGRL